MNGGIAGGPISEGPLSEGESPGRSVASAGTFTARRVLRYATADVDGLQDFYDGRIVDAPSVTRSAFDTFWGPVTVQNVRFSLANADGALIDYHRSDPRGRTLALRRYDAASGYLRTVFTGVVSATALAPGKLWVEGTSLDVSVMTTMLPRVLVDRDAYPLARDLGRPIPVVFGQAPQVPCLLIKNDPEHNLYDYMVGWGDLSILQVYRDDGTARRIVRPSIDLDHQASATHATVALEALTWPHTVSRLPNQVLVVFVSCSGGSVSSVTYAGLPLALLGQVQSGIPCLFVFALMVPPVGTANVVAHVNFLDCVGVSLTYPDVDMSMMPGDFAFASRSGADLSVSVPQATAAGDRVIGGFVGLLNDAIGGSPASEPPTVSDGGLDHPPDTPTQAPLWGGSAGLLYTQGASAIATAEAATLTWHRGTPSRAAQLKPWVAASIRLRAAPGPAWERNPLTDDASGPVYPGTTVLRFHGNPAPGTDATPPTLYADAISPARDFPSAIQALLSDPDWGLGQAVDAASFAQATLQLGKLGAPLYCDGALTGQEQAQTWLAELSMVRGMRLWLDELRRWTLLVDAPTVMPRMTVRDGPGDGERNIVAIGECAWDSLIDSVRVLIFAYRQDLGPVDVDTLGKEQFAYTITRPVNDSFGVEKRYPNRFIRDHASASLVANFLATRVTVGQQSCPITLPQQARDLREGDLIRVSRADVGLANVLLEIVKVTDTLRTIEVIARSYDPSIYAYAGLLPSVPADPDPTIWQDYTRTPPDPATTLVILDSGTEVLAGPTVAFVFLQWTAPSGAVSLPQSRLTVYGDEQPEPWISGARVAGSGTRIAKLTGLIPAERYDFSVQTVNAFGLTSIGDPVLAARLVANVPGAPAPAPRLLTIASFLGVFAGDALVTVGYSVDLPPPTGSPPAVLVDVYAGETPDPHLARLMGQAFWTPTLAYYAGQITLPVATRWYVVGKTRTPGGSSGFSAAVYNDVQT